MDFEKLNELKQHILAASDFQDPLDYFFEHFSLDTEFIEKTERVNHVLIEQVVEKVGQQLFGEDAKLSKSLLVEIAEYHFICGTCFIAGHAVNILFFNDIDVGLLGIVVGNEKIVTARFSGAVLSSAGDKAFYVPNASKTIH